VDNDGFDEAMADLTRRLENSGGLSLSERADLVREGREFWLRHLAKLEPGERDGLLRALEDESPAAAAYAQKLYDGEGDPR
jgi:hypothetical protein